MKHTLTDLANNYIHNFPSKQRKNNIQPLLDFINKHPDIKLVLSDKNLGLVALNLIEYHKLVMENLQLPQYQFVEPKINIFLTPILLNKKGIANMKIASDI